MLCINRPPSSVSSMQRKYTVIIGDVVGSSVIPDRVAFARVLAKACLQANTTFREDIYAPIATTGIDTISGVLVNIANAYRIVSIILETIHPTLMRFAIVRAPLDVGLRSRDARRMDGIAFHRAADMILSDKKSANLVAFELGDPIVDNLLNSHVNLVLSIKTAWTDRQSQVVTMYKRLKNQQEVAKRLRVSQATVSEILNTADRHGVLDAERVVNFTLAEYQARSGHEKHGSD